MKAKFSLNKKNTRPFFSLLFILIIFLLLILLPGCGCGCKTGVTSGITVSRPPLVVGQGMEYATPHEAVKNCRDGDTILIMEGTYTFEKGLELFEKNNITILGREKVELVCTNMDDNVMWILTCNNIRIRNIKARHTNPTKEERCYGNVFALDSSTKVIIDDCEINGCGAIGVYASGCKDVLLRRNHIHNNSLWAVQHNGVGFLGEVDHIEDLRFLDNKIENNGRGK